jgi:hypothetical protein
MKRTNKRRKKILILNGFFLKKMAHNKNDIIGFNFFNLTKTCV